MIKFQDMEYAAFPGGDMIQRGIKDLQGGTESQQALLVAIGAPRLARLGFKIPTHEFDRPEIRLYQKLSVSDPDLAHSRYNALIRRLVSFERAVECAS